MSDDNVRRDYMVYMLCDPSKNNQPFYIGKGRKNSEYNRINAHYRNKNLLSGNPEFNDRKVAIIINYRALGYQDSYKILQAGLTNEQALELEFSYIKLFGRIKDGGCLVNVTSKGSRGQTGKKRKPPSKETLKKMSDAQKGKKLSQETKEKIRLAHTGRKRPKEVGEKIKASRTWGPLTDKQKEAVAANMAKGHTPPKWYKITSPENVVWVVLNKYQFCLEFNLNSASMNDIMAGRMKNYKGWGCTHFTPTEEILKEYERSGNPSKFKTLWLGPQSSESSKHS